MAEKEEVKIVYNEGCPDWMLTFGDCMSLLLCFFVMLMTFSTPDENKLMEVIGGLQGALGVVSPAMINAKRLSMTRPTDAEQLDGTISRGDEVQNKVDPDEVSPINLRDIKIKNKFATFKEELYKLGFKNVITTQRADGYLLEMPLDALFVQNSDEMKPGASKWMEPLAGMVASLGNEVRMVACLPLGAPIALARNRLDALSFVLVSRYKIKADRVAIGVEFPEDSEKFSVLRVLIADKTISKEISMEDFFKSESEAKGGRPE